MGDITYDSFGKIAPGLDHAGRGRVALRIRGIGLRRRHRAGFHERRYYDPNTGRFLSEDPTGFAGASQAWVVNLI